MTTINKSELRAEISRQNMSVRHAEREKIAQEVFFRIEQMSQFKNAKTIALYSALSDELPTSDILQRWSVYKRVCLPVVEGDSMRFFVYDPQKPLTPKAYGILEPTQEELIAPDQIDMIVVPSVAYDRGGGRLGRGKGFYDRYMSQQGFRAYKIGICSPHQLIETLPYELHDVKVDCVLCG